MTASIHHRICPLCEACCGLEISVEDGRVQRIRGHEADVFSHGFICPKGVALKELHEDPDRLRTPLIRRDGRHVEATWDEAMALIAQRLPEIQAREGRAALATCVGNPAAHKIGLLLYFARFARALGSPHIYSASTLDQMPKQLSSGWMFGHWLSIPVPDLPRTDWMLMLGANPMASNGSLWTVPDFRGKARAMQARGGKLIVVDPRRTETAALADEHAFIRPGTDALLLMAMVHTLFEQGWVRLGRLADHVEGVEAWREACAGFSPETVAPHCGIGAEVIRRWTRELAHTEHAVVYGRIGTCTQRHGTLNSALVDVLNALTGHLDEPGGAMFPLAAAFAANTAGSPGVGRGIGTPRHVSRVSGAPEVMGELPISCLAEEIETPGPGQIKALITVATNPVLSAPQGERLAKALGRLDFMVSLDIYLNETTRHADVILPGLSPLEDMHYDVAFPQFSWRNHARYSAPVFARPPGMPAEWETLTRLAAIVGPRQSDPVDANAADAEFFEDQVRRQAGENAEAVIAATVSLRGPDRWLDLALRTGPYGDQFGRRSEGLHLAKVQAAEGGIDLGELQPGLPALLRTPNGKVTLMVAPLRDDVAVLRESIQRPAPPLVVIGRRDMRSNNSWMHNLPLLAKGPNRCTALLHPDDAARRGVRDQGRVRLRNPRSGTHIDVDVHLSADVMPGVVCVPHGWGHDQPGTRMQVAAQRPGVNLNTLLDDSARDPLSGTSVLSGLEVEVHAIA